MRIFSKKELQAEIKKRTFWLLNHLFHPFELFWYNADYKEFIENHPPVFILGPPRSGTTVLYQLMCQHFNFGYINNFVANWYKLPITATRFYKRKNHEKNTINLKSDYGRSNNSFGPHEFSEFWYRWFSRKQIEKRKMSNSNILKIRKTIGCLTAIHNNSMILKNVVHSVRIPQLSSIFSNCVFIVVERDHLDIAQSILNARQTLYGNKNEWWSVKIPEFDKIKNEPYWIQIAEQVKSVYSLFQSSFNEIGTTKTITIHYRELCHQTSKVLTSLHSQLVDKGISVETDGLFPESLNYSTGQKVSDEDYNKLKEVLMKSG